jgi:DNA modification methylase
MNTPSTGFAVPQEETVVVVETSSIKINKEKQKLYSVDKAYESLKLSIQHFGIKEPLIVEKGTNIVISGNRRLKVAIELKIATIPVIFRELNETPKDKSVVYVTHEIQREKTYSQYLAEYRILQQKFPLTQGARTDLKQVEKLNAEALRVLSGLSRTTLYYLLEIDRMAIEKYKDGKDSKSYKNIWNDLDEGYKTPKYWYDRLNPKTKEDKKKVVPTLPPMLLDYCQVLNRSCDDLSCIEDNSVSCFMSSPPNWKGKNKSVVTGDIPLGDESDSDEYLDKLVDTYKKALPKLKKGGSIWVNLSDVVVDGEYVIIPHRFVLKMRKIGLVLNDEVTCVKTPKIDTNVKRTARGFESIFHFIRETDKRVFFYDKTWLTDGASLKMAIAKSDSEYDEKYITSTFDFRDGILKTENPNYAKLRRACKVKKMDSDFDSKLTIDMVMVPILLTSKEKDLVVDLFGNIGTVALVAGALGRKSITFEVDPINFNLARTRLTELVSQWESSDFSEDETLSHYENEVVFAA